MLYSKASDACSQLSYHLEDLSWQVLGCMGCTAVSQDCRAGDPSACALQNHMLEVDAKRAPAPGWETIRYMVSVVQYGGRITSTTSCSWTPWPRSTSSRCGSGVQAIMCFSLAGNCMHFCASHLASQIKATMQVCVDTI